MSEMTIDQLQAEIADLKRGHAALWEAINSIRQKPPVDIPRLVRVMEDKFGARPTVARR
jgi:hypothetical protein